MSLARSGEGQNQWQLIATASKLAGQKPEGAYHSSEVSRAVCSPAQTPE